MSTRSCVVSSGMGITRHSWSFGSHSIVYLLFSFGVTWIYWFSKSTSFQVRFKISSRLSPLQYATEIKARHHNSSIDSIKVWYSSMLTSLTGLADFLRCLIFAKGFCPSLTYPRGSIAMLNMPRRVRIPLLTVATLSSKESLSATKPSAWRGVIWASWILLPMNFSKTAL